MEEKQNEKKRSLFYHYACNALVSHCHSFADKSTLCQCVFCNTTGAVGSFLAFLLIGAMRWFGRIENRGKQTRGQEIGWTVAFLLFEAYFLWMHWNRYSFGQGWLITAICVVSIIGLIIRLFCRWDSDCVRWVTWAVCCAVVSFSIAGCIVFLHPMTVEEAKALVIAGEDDDRFTFQYIYNGANMVNHHAAEAPFGYYMFSIKNEDGAFDSYGTGRAVVYLGDAQEEYRNPDPDK